MCVCFSAAIKRGGRLRSAAVRSALLEPPDEKNPQEVANASENVGAAEGGAEPEHQNHDGTEITHRPPAGCGSWLSVTDYQSGLINQQP